MTSKNFNLKTEKELDKQYAKYKIEVAIYSVLEKISRQIEEASGLLEDEKEETTEAVRQEQ